MNDPKSKERRLFEEAFELPIEERRRFLENELQHEPKLLARLSELLEISDSTSRFMKTDGRPESDSSESRPRETWGPGSIIGHYRLTELLGEGGFGLVYRAEQTEPIKRTVALKIIKPGMESRELVGRLNTERQALALMDHPNIAKALDAGATESGHPYFVMELVPGVPITQYCDEARLSLRERLQLFLPILSAVHHAHQKGIIHRDIKPTNVLVTVRDGEAIPKIIDFGIAKALERKLTDITVFTQWRQFLGTPAYMSPEQIDGNSDDIDTRADIYSLGALLYELLAGRAPFTTQELLAEGVFAMRQRIKEEEPPKPSLAVTTLNATDLEAVANHRKEPTTRLPTALRGEIDWIVMKALEKDRERRYESANAFRNDLQNFLNGEPVSAAAPTTAYRLKKFARKHRAATATAAIIAVGLLLSTAVSWRFALQTSQAIEEKQASLYAADIREAQNRIDAGDLIGARQLLEPHTNSPERGWEWSFLYNQLDGHPHEVVGEFGFGVGSSAISSDGRFIGATGNAGEAAVFDLLEKKVVWTNKGSVGRIDASFSHDDRFFALCDWGYTAHPEHKTRIDLWDFQNNRIVWTSQKSEDTRFAFSPIAPIAAVSLGGNLGTQILDLNTFSQIKKFSSEATSTIHSSAKDRPANRVAFSKDGKLAYSIEGGAFVKIIDVASGKVILKKARLNINQDEPITDDLAEVLRLKFNQNGNQLWATYLFKSPLMVNTDTREVSSPLNEGAEHCHKISFSNDTLWIGGAGYDHTVRLWSANDFSLKNTFRGHDGEVGSVEFHPDSQSIYSMGISGHGEIYKWSLATSTQTQRIQRYPEPSTPSRSKPIFSKDESRVFLESEDHSIYAIDLSANLLTKTPYQGIPIGLAQEPPSLLTLSGSREPTAHTATLNIWKLQSPNHQSIEVPIHPQFWTGGYQKFSYNSSNNTAIYPYSTPKVIHISTQSGEIIEELNPKTLDIIQFARWNNSGDRYLTIERSLSDPGPVIMNVFYGSPRNAKLTKSVRFTVPDGRGVLDAQFSEDNRWIAIRSLQSFVYIFDTLKAPMSARVLGNHLRACKGACFSPDSKSLATVADDKTLRVWSLANARQLLDISLDFFPCNVVFSPEGSWLVVTGGKTPLSPDHIQWWSLKNQNVKN